MRLFMYAFFFVVTVSAASLEEEKVKFQVFKINYGKTYKNRLEEMKRFHIFKDNIYSIEQHNALYEQGLASYKQGVNKFADMTKQEFGAMLTLSASNKLHFNATRHVKTGLAIPDSVDWRIQGQVTEVKDQGICGSCWAFSITGSTEGAYYRKSGELISLSEQQLIDCSVGINHGCDGGFLEQTFPYIEQYGLQSEDSYPFIAIDGGCNYSAKKVVAKLTDYKVIDPNDENALLDAVANIGPVSVGMDATFLSLYESGIFEDSRCSKTQLGHGVLIVGYGIENGTKFWIVKNSWGQSWGEHGYLRLKRGCNECGIAKDTVYPTCN